MTVRFLIWTVCTLAGMVHPSSATESEACAVHARVAEQASGIPEGLLGAVTLAESGRALHRSVKAWPWTVQTGGRSLYFDTRQDAVRTVRQLIRQGVRNIDVGCAQVNLGHHPRAFRSLEEAFDPARNTRYAARLLTWLAHRNGSWEKAVALYHSARPSLHTVYRNKVWKIWEQNRPPRRLALPEPRPKPAFSPPHTVHWILAAGP